MITELISRLTSLAAAKRATQIESYEQLVAAIVRGEPPADSMVLAILETAGKSAEDLEADASKKLRYQRNLALASQLSERRAAQRVSAAREKALQVEFEAAIARLREEFASQSAAAQAESALRNSEAVESEQAFGEIAAQEPIVKQLAAAVESLAKVSEMIPILQEALQGAESSATIVQGRVKNERACGNREIAERLQTQADRAVKAVDEQARYLASMQYLKQKREAEISQLREQLAKREDADAAVLAQLV